MNWCVCQPKWHDFTFVGELGWELFLKKEHMAELYEALLTAGEEYGIGDFGTYALNSLRLEKGFRAWGFEVFIFLDIIHRLINPFTTRVNYGDM